MLRYSSSCENKCLKELQAWTRYESITSAIPVCSCQLIYLGNWEMFNVSWSIHMLAEAEDMKVNSWNVVSVHLTALPWSQVFLLNTNTFSRFKFVLRKEADSKDSFYWFWRKIFQTLYLYREKLANENVNSGHCILDRQDLVFCLAYGSRPATRNRPPATRSPQPWELKHRTVLETLSLKKAQLHKTTYSIYTFHML